MFSPSMYWVFQSTHPSRGATISMRPSGFVRTISIHAPLTGCDQYQTAEDSLNQDISIHAPLTGCDALTCSKEYFIINFNPRTPHGVRRLTTSRQTKIQNFNPRTPHGVRPLPTLKTPPKIDFNPRTPHGVRQRLEYFLEHRHRFQSTHPSRGATYTVRWMNDFTEFQSTHPSRGATSVYAYFLAPNVAFQSTHPSRGATPPNLPRLGRMEISINAPLTGCDDDFALPDSVSAHFNPRTPHGVRRIRICKNSVNR